MSQTDMQFKAQLLDEYTRLKRIKQKALSEGADGTAAYIDEELELIKLKLQPLELPEI
ncbi:MAG: hypothetical protein NC253_01940 [Ruminococcus sp.]|nr:hypothetical protein [Ruminococcus sp.]MCM1380408.1 hypothetical protein [Muribaculaceae bacterium]MCM1478056.1 hypothetical protein [Muribaculaceae bacterium]